MARPGTWSRPTGAPPLAMQLAHQVRTSTGATFVTSGKMIALTPLIMGRTSQPYIPPSAVGPSEYERLYDHLRRLARAKAPLPGLFTIAEALGGNATSASVSHQLRRLVAAGRIHWWNGQAVGLRGRYIIRLPDEPNALRSAGIPEEYQL